MSRKKRVLVLCAGNSCRSQMAEGWLGHDLGGSVEVFSAGTRPALVHPLAVRVMAEAGVDISGHRSKAVSDFLRMPFDLVVTVCDSARVSRPVLPGTVKPVHVPFPDPAGFAGSDEEALHLFREVRDLIRERLEPLVRRELRI